MTPTSRNQSVVVYSVAAGIILTATAISKIRIKREAKQGAQEASARNIVYTHHMDQLDALTEDLDRRIEIGKQALIDDDFRGIIEDL